MLHGGLIAAVLVLRPAPAPPGPPAYMVRPGCPPAAATTAGAGGPAPPRGQPNPAFEARDSSADAAQEERAGEESEALARACHSLEHRAAQSERIHPAGHAPDECL